MIKILSVLMVTWACAQAEMFTAMADMDSLLYTEKHVVSVIDQYIEMETKRLERLKE